MPSESEASGLYDGLGALNLRRHRGVQVLCAQNVDRKLPLLPRVFVINVINRFVFAGEH